MVVLLTELVDVQPGCTDFKDYVMNARGTDWREYVNDDGEFALPNYLFRLVNHLMKLSLDMGTLLSDDKAKLRSYKERIKSDYKDAWKQIAEAFEYFDIIVPCGCKSDEFCESCNGSRYNINATLSAAEVREIGLATVADADDEVAKKLRKGLKQALKEIS